MPNEIFQKDLQQSQNQAEMQDQFTMNRRRIVRILLPRTLGFELRPQDEVLKSSILAQSVQRGKIHEMLVELNNQISRLNEIELKVSEVNGQPPAQLTLDNFNSVRENFTTKQTERHNTICLLHRTNCHAPCTLKRETQIGSSSFLACAAYKRKSECQECKCEGTTHHVHANYIFETKGFSLDPLLPQGIIDKLNKITDPEQKKVRIIAELKKQRQTTDQELQKCCTQIKNFLKNQKRTSAGFLFEYEIDRAIILQKLKKKDADRLIENEENRNKWLVSLNEVLKTLRQIEASLPQ
eukprot:TRINITY_DN15406_c0_g1_i1.p1 TRINITY_DN15406_c0_g1~~TRINITY_DN15406_c0_g1_i1.p1  ORF type:complete len:296 (+),score=30.31 TRINITY_DN15406_c0_g1_i1:409-1296(+)